MKISGVSHSLVAIAVELALGVVVACDPVLVVSAAAVHHDRVVPVESVLGAADGDVHSRVANGKAGDQPHSVLRVINHGCVTGR